MIPVSALPPCSPSIATPKGYARQLGPLAEAVLQDIVHHRAMLAHTVLWRHWVTAGRVPTQGYRILARLRALKLVTVLPLDPTLGRASRMVVQATAAGRVLCGATLVSRFPP